MLPAPKRSFARFLRQRVVPQRTGQDQRRIHAAGLFRISCLSAYHPCALRREGVFDAEAHLGSSAPGGGPESRERTPEGTPFNVGVWVGPDGESVIAGSIPARTAAGSKPISARRCRREARSCASKICSRRWPKCSIGWHRRSRAISPSIRRTSGTRALRIGPRSAHDEQQESDLRRFQGDWAARVENNGEGHRRVHRLSLLRHRRHRRISR